MAHEILIIDNFEVQVSETLAKEFIAIDTEKKELEKRDKKAKELLMMAMKEANVSKAVCEVNDTKVTLTVIPENNSVESFNKEKFREENEALYNKYAYFGHKNEWLKVDIKKSKKK